MENKQTRTQFEKELRSADSLATAYDMLRTPFLDALTRLAYEGYALPPSDYHDLVHDFFLEVWPKVVSAYDEKKGPIKGYAYVAFVNFVRARLKKQHRYRKVLADVLAQKQQTPHDEPELHRAYEHDIEIMQQAKRLLPNTEQALLNDYFSEAGLSERTLAKKYGFTRYGIRKALVEALGRLAVLIDEMPAGMNELDWKVTRAILAQNFTLAQAAAYYGLTTHQARQAHARTFQWFVRSLEYATSPTR